MALIGRYVFKRMLAAALLSLGGLASTVWLSQALRQLNLVTTQGQSFLTFMQVSALIFPGLLLIVCPVAVLIGVIYTLNQLNADSELVVINAAGSSPLTMLKPAVTLGMIGMVVVAAMTLELVPLSLRAAREMITSINSDFISIFVQEGTFVQFGDDLVFHIRNRNADGTLEGIFIQDERDKDQSTVYIAGQGIILKNPLGTFLVMHNGTIEQRSRESGSMSIIQFESYAFDMSSFGNSVLPGFSAAERSTAYLLSPDPNDPEFQKRPGSFAAELHDRFSSPLYTLLFAMLPVMALGQAQTTRQGRGVLILLTVLVATGLRVAGFILAGAAASQTRLIPLLYLLPLSMIGLALFATMRSYRFSASEGIGSAVTDLVRRLTTRPRPTGGMA